LQKSRGTLTSPTIVADDDHLGVIAAYGWDGTDSNTTAGMIQFSVDGTPGSNDMPGRITFHTTADGAAAVTERMRIDSAGYVGIGTTAPSAPLDIVMSHTDTTVANMSSNETLELTNTGAVNGAYNAIGFHGNQQSMFMAAFNHSTQASRRIGFFVGSSTGDAVDEERLSIMGNGYVGIGTSAPDRFVTIDNISEGGSLWCGLKSTGSNSVGFLLYHDSTVLWHNYLFGNVYRIADTANDDGMYMNQGGNVWVAISSDERKKTDWVNFTNATDKINTLTKLGNYKRIEPTTGEYMNEDQTLTGISAQEVQAILPHAVDSARRPVENFPDDDTEYLSLNYQDVFVLGLKAIQELSAKNDALEAKVTALENA
jgi:hypothetical protein